jgi:dienelactone hydrolase
MTAARRAFCSLVALLATLSTAPAQDVVKFPSLDGTTTLTAYLSRPSGDQPRPAVVLLHGCSGLVDRRGRIFPNYHAWTRALLAKGYVALAIDSASSRGFGQTCTAGEERRTQLRDRPKDAYAGLAYLQAQSFVDRGRVAVMGWSQGGGIVLLSVNDQSIGRPPQLTQDFKAAIAFYPGSCSDRLQSKPFTQVEPHGWTSRIPTLVLFGEADVWTRFPPCRDFVEEARSRGNPIELKSYPDAVHSFDAPNADRRELPDYRLADGTVPIVGTDDLARADALLRAFAFLDGEFGR